jgi:rhomboid protease GluP
MNNSYLNAIYTHLILERDYEPLRNGDGVLVFNEENRVLQKYRNGIHYLVELVDGDRFDAASLAAKLGLARQMLLEAKPQQVIHLIMVLVFNDTPGDEKLQAMDIEPDSSNLVRKYFSCFTVNLKEQTVSYNERNSLPTDGVNRILKRFLSVTNDEYQSLPDLGQILAQKARDYTIKLKTDQPTVTYVLIGINVVVWLLSMVTFSYGSIHINLFELGIKLNDKIINGQFWRLLIPVFLHDIPLPLHILVNSYSLYVLGQYVERIFGHYKFIIVYLAAGIMGNIASFAFSPHPAIGASGAIFGLLGAVLYYGLENPKVFKKYFGYNVFATIILNVAIGFSLRVIIDNFAHLGGLTGGFLVAGIVRVNARPDKFPGRYLFLAVTLLLAALGLYYGFHYWGNI